ncbi:MAG: phage integrase SAM-like domain-containing protein [Cyclobacteriaceae bacterium]|nr:MAG: phage integrase SAM-like domain-containing protein [Cyclobacteriaceae bacterium]
MKTEFKITYFFWKARKDKSGKIPVYIRSKQNSDKQYSYYTGVKLLKAEWNPKKKQPTNKPARLLELEKKLQATYKDLMQQGHAPTLENILTHLNDPKKPQSKKLLDWCNDYLSADKYSPGQKKAVATLKENILGFQPSLTFDRLNTHVLDDFADWMTNRGVANNSQYKRIRALVNVAKHARVNITDLSGYELPYSTSNANKVRLEWPEVKAVMNTKPITEIEAVAKDVFLLACFSGLRISDLQTLGKGKIKGFYYERLQTKTKKPVYTTLHKYNEELFHKYFKGIPYSRQNLSSALKPLLERAGLDEEVTVLRQVGHNVVEETKRKFDEIAFHSGRRFYARLLNDLGLGNEIARDELGHSPKSVTEHYAGSPNHKLRVQRVRQAMEKLEKTMKEMGLMKVA